MRWKAIFFINRNRKPFNNTTEAKFGLKSNQFPPQEKELMAFEDDLITLVKEIKFRKVKYPFIGQSSFFKQLQVFGGTLRLVSEYILIVIVY